MSYILVIKATINLSSDLVLSLKAWGVTKAKVKFTDSFYVFKNKLKWRPDCAKE